MIYLSLGSNLGHRLAYLQKAAERLKTLCFPHTPMFTTIVLETEAILAPENPHSWSLPYLNTIVYGESTLSLTELHRSILQIEQELGKSPQAIKNQPRTIDIDILIYHDFVGTIQGVDIPHPRLTQRPFLLHLLSTIATELTIPSQNHSCLTLLSGTSLNNTYQRSFALFPRLLGIVNVTQDSFSDGNQYFETDQALQHIDQLISTGATLIDIGGQSTRPQTSAQLLTWQEEYERIAPVVDVLQARQDLSVSIDSFVPEVIREILRQFSVTWINDVSGRLEDDILSEICAYGAGIISTHALSIPVLIGESLPTDDNPCPTVLTWIQATYEHLKKIGFSKNQIMMDPGIGYGKKPHQNLTLLRHTCRTLQSLDCLALFAHSRKSFLTTMTNRPPHERDLETAMICSLLRAPNQFFRVHDVESCQRAMTIHQLIEPMAL